MQSMGSVVAALRLESTVLVVVAQRLSCSVACGVFLDQGSNPRLLHWQADSWFSSWVRKIPWRREWLSIPVFLPGESHGQRSLADCSLWRHKELDVTE